MNEQLVTGRKYRILTDAVNKIWDRISFWTASTDVEMGDGHTLEQNLGSIKGITTSTNVSNAGYAADASTVSGLKSNVNTLTANMGGLRFGQKDGEYGYYTGAGADTFRPFKDPNYQSAVILPANWSSPIDIKQITNKYRELTYRDFYPIAGHAHASVDACGNGSNSISAGPICEYDPNTGMFRGGQRSDSEGGLGCGTLFVTQYVSGWILIIP